MVGDLADANKAIAEARDFKHVSLRVQKIPMDDLVLLVSADAPWTSEGDLKSQGAYLVAATSRDIYSGGRTKINPLKWKSQKQERAVSSTLAAELLTVSKGVAETMWLRQFFLEALNEDYDLSRTKEYVSQIPVVAVTDNKPVNDHCKADHGCCQDKRLAIEMLLLRRDLRDHNAELKWVDTRQMLVDCMTKTKIRPDLRRHVLKSGSYCLLEVLKRKTCLVPRSRSVHINNTSARRIFACKTGCVRFSLSCRLYSHVQILRGLRLRLEKALSNRLMLLRYCLRTS